MTVTIGGSSAAAILGLDRSKNIHDVFGRIVFGREVKKTRPMEIGLFVEPLIQKFYEEDIKKHGQVFPDINECEARRISKKYPFMSAHPDWLELDGKKIVAGAEFKFAGYHNAREWGDEGQVPQEYYIQCLHYMIVFELKAWDLAVLIGTDFKIYHLQYNQKIAEKLIEAEKTFYEKHLLPKIPPPPDDSTSCAQVLGLVFTPRKPLEAATGTEIAVLEDYRALYEQANKTETTLKTMQNKIRAMIGEREGISFHDGKVTWKRNKEGKRILLSKFNGA